MAKYRQSCIDCGGSEKVPCYHDERRDKLLVRCGECRCNFHGPGVWIPLEWAHKSPRGLSIDVDPCLGHGHGHGRCDRIADPRQCLLFVDGEEKKS